MKSNSQQIFTSKVRWKPTAGGAHIQSILLRDKKGDTKRRW